MSELSITATDIKKSLDTMTLQENGDIGRFKENIFNPFTMGFCALGAVTAYRNNTGLYLSKCNDRATRQYLRKLIEIDNAYLNKMCTSKNLAIATRAQLLKGQINIAKRRGLTKDLAENLLKEFNLLSKQYHNGFSKVLATKASGLHRAWKAQGGIMMMIMGIGAELFNIIPAFKESAGSGVKQTGKSIGKTILNTGGWVAGAAAGAAIGSLIPGAGTVIGGAIGAITSFLGGSLGMFGADKLSESVGLTKNEATTITNEKQEQENIKIADKLVSGDVNSLQLFADKFNTWVTENNIFDENGNVRENLSKDIKKEYEQIFQTAAALGLTTA